MITIYLYPNTVEVRIWDPTIFTTRNREMYARPVTIYQGIDNPIQVRVRNQDQKAINMTPYAIQVDIQDPVNNLTVISYAVKRVIADKGFGTFTIPKSDANQLTQRNYRLTFRAINIASDAEQPAYIDDNYGVPIDLIVLPAYYAEMPPVEGETNANDFTTLDGGTIQ